MAAGRYTFTIEQGTTVDFEVAYLDSGSNAIDLTGYEARMQIRQNPASTSAYITLSSSLASDGTGLNMSGSSGTNPLTSGTIGIYISAASSSALDFSKACYDLEIVSGSNPYTVTRLLEGKIKLNKEITQGSY